MEKVLMELGGMSCPSCLDKIKTAVEHQAGVSEVKVLFNAGKLKATVDSGRGLVAIHGRCFEAGRRKPWLSG